jgi:hypothetical protein
MDSDSCNGVDVAASFGKGITRMIVLTTTNDTIQALLGAVQTTAPMQCFASYRDITTTLYTPGRNLQVTNGTTPVNLVPAPSGSTQRVVDFLSVHNTDTTPKLTTIRFNDGTNTRILFQCTLGVGEKIEYNDGQGFQVFTSVGSIKQSLNQGASPVSSGVNAVVLASAQTNNNAVANTFQDITGLSFPVIGNGVNLYWYRFVIAAATNATGNGYRFAIAIPTNNILGYRVIMPNSTTAAAISSAAAADATALQTASAVATPNVNVITMEGFIRPTADGNVLARFASELAGPTNLVRAEAGSFVQWLQVI